MSDSESFFEEIDEFLDNDSDTGIKQIEENESESISESNGTAVESFVGVSNHSESPTFDQPENESNLCPNVVINEGNSTVQRSQIITNLLDDCPDPDELFAGTIRLMTTDAEIFQDELSYAEIPKRVPNRKPIKNEEKLREQKKKSVMPHFRTKKVDESSLPYWRLTLEKQKRLHERSMTKQKANAKHSQLISLEENPLLLQKERVVCARKEIVIKRLEQQISLLNQQARADDKVLNTLTDRISLEKDCAAALSAKTNAETALRELESKCVDAQSELEREEQRTQKYKNQYKALTDGTDMENQRRCVSITAEITEVNQAITTVKTRNEIETKALATEKQKVKQLTREQKKALDQIRVLEEEIAGLQIANEGREQTEVLKRVEEEKPKHQLRPSPKQKKITPTEHPPIIEKEEDEFGYRPVPPKQIANPFL